MKFLILAPDNDDNRRTTSFAGSVDDSANEAFASKWNQLLGSTETRRFARCQNHGSDSFGARRHVTALKTPACRRISRLRGSVFFSRAKTARSRAQKRAESLQRSQMRFPPASLRRDRAPQAQ